MARLYIALGSNLGDRAAHLLAGVGGCSRHGLRLIALSSIYETEPVGGPPGQKDHLNAVGAFESGLDPAVVLRILGQVEDAESRTRGAADGPRTLDLDLLLAGGAVRSDELIQLPHPRMHLRRFVLEPLAEIAPDVVVPTLGRTAAELLQELKAREGAAAPRIRIYSAPSP